MSYNNYVDADAAHRAAYDHGDQPTVAIIKHANPCGIAVGSDIAEAHRLAHACDPVSAYGGIIATNRPVTREMAETVKDIFTEVVVAPGFDGEALDILTAKKNLRLLVVDPPPVGGVEIRPISGGLLLQERDALDAEGHDKDGNTTGDDTTHWRLVAGDAVDEQTLADLRFAWRAIR
ncbi:MAG: bifunctional phosphoribosylaminoimidazolecarboxamide formyltransferase/IMP cyclohydrolase, partial [Paracoccus hibiscisoli]